MERELLKFKDKDGIERVFEIHYEMGNYTTCSNCPFKVYTEDIWTKTSTCSILAQENNTPHFLDNNRPFIDFYGNFFCSRNKIISALEISSGNRVKFGEDFKRQRKFSLGDLIDKVCPGRCVFMEDTSKCTEEYRKCPGCLLEGLEKD